MDFSANRWASAWNSRCSAVRSKEIMQALLDVGQQPAALDDALQEFRVGGGLIVLSAGQVADGPGGGLNLQLVSRLNAVNRCGGLQDGPPDVDGVAEEDAGEGAGDHC